MLNPSLLWLYLSVLPVIGLALSCPALPCPRLLALPCPALPCPTLPCPVCPVLSCLAPPMLLFPPWLDSYLITVTKAHIEFPELKEALRLGRITSDGSILHASGQCNVTKARLCCRPFA